MEIDNERNSGAIRTNKMKNCGVGIDNERNSNAIRIYKIKNWGVGECYEKKKTDRIL